MNELSAHYEQGKEAVVYKRVSLILGSTLVGCFHDSVGTHKVKTVALIALMLLFLGGAGLASYTEGPFATFFAIHMEAREMSRGKFQEEMWPNLVKLVEVADSYEAKLTLMFNPQWAEYILKDSAKFALVKNWQKNGHEVALHYHNVWHRDWNGYTNRKDEEYTRSPRYRGTVEQMMALVTKLAEPKELLTMTMGPKEGSDYSFIIDEVDFPDGIIYDIDGFDNGLSKVLRTKFRNKEIYHLKHHFFNLKRREHLDKIKEEFARAGQDEVLGVVTHEMDFAQAPDFIEQWFKFCQEKGVKIRTVRDIIESYPKEKFVDTQYIVQEDISIRRPFRQESMREPASIKPTPPQKSSHKQSQSSYWIKAIGGGGKEYAPTIQVIGDGYVVIGWTNSFGAGDLDFLAVKLDKYGNLLWSRTIGGPGEEKVYCIEPTKDGGYIVVGNTKSFGAGDLDFLTVKLKPDLSIDWAKAIGGEGADLGFYAQEVQEGGYIVVGTTQSYTRDGRGKNGLILKLDEKGNLIWAKTIGGEGFYGITGIQKTTDGGYILNGAAGSPGEKGGDALIVKIDRDCNIQWARRIGGADKDTTNWNGVRQISDGGYIFCGETGSFGKGDYDCLVVKIDNSGNLLWAKTVGGEDDDAGWAINETSDGGFIMGGVANRSTQARLEGKAGMKKKPQFREKMRDKPFPLKGRRRRPQEQFQESKPDTGNIDIFLSKLDKNGNLIWARTIGGSRPGLEEIEEVIEIKDGYILAGITEAFGAGKGDFFVAKLNKDGLCPGSDVIKTFSATAKDINPRFMSISPVVTQISPQVSSVPPKVTTPELQVEDILTDKEERKDFRPRRPMKEGMAPHDNSEDYFWSKLEKGPYQDPYRDKISFAVSKDLLNWVDSKKILAEHASVPGAVYKDGVIYVYFVDFSTDGIPEQLALIKSNDLGKTWSEKKIIKIQGVGGKIPVDPAPLLLKDGRIRLYYYDISNRGRGENNFYSVISEDGENFIQEEGVRFSHVDIMDPDVIKVGDVWRMYAGDAKRNRVITAVSSNGINFQEDGIAFEGGAVPNVFYKDGIYYLYTAGIDISKSDDGKYFYTTGYTFYSNLGKATADPSVIQAEDLYIMFYKFKEF